MNNTSKPNQQQTKRPQQAHHANFIEALKSAGSSIVKDTASGIVNDAVLGTGRQMVDTIFGGSSTDANNPNPQNPNITNNNFDFGEYLNSGEDLAKKQRAHDRVKYEYEQSETVIFNRRQEEVAKKIEQIQIEMKQLAKSIVSLDSTTTTVIDQEVVDPGLYHLSFFENLLSFLRETRKRITESRNWAAMHAQRGQSRSYYWNQVNSKKGGTQYMLSQERQVVTQTG